VKQLVRAHAGAAKRLASRPLMADRAGLPAPQLIVGRLDPCGRLIATARHAIADCAAALGRVLDAR